jgi:hypothetical protein
MKINEIIVESTARDYDIDSHSSDDKNNNGIPDSHETATPGLRKHPKLDNSSPYHPWRFAAHFLGGAGDPSGKYDHEPSRDGPNGQSLVAAAYSKADQQILDQAAKAFGAEANHIKLTSDGSKEMSDTHKASPVPHNSGAKRKKK